MNDAQNSIMDMARFQCRYHRRVDADMPTYGPARKRAGGWNTCLDEITGETK